MTDEQWFEHTAYPIYNEKSKILILGTFPSVKSREMHFFYGHPRNRFWPLMAELTKSPIPETVEQKTRLLIDHGIALWDVVASCRVDGSDDSSIRDVIPNDLTPILQAAPIGAIYANGAKAYELYNRWCKPIAGMECMKLPSTSPANAAWSMERLKTAWSVILEKM